MNNVIEKSIGRIICGEEHGTAFLISNRLLLTAEHVVHEHILDSKQNIEIEFPNYFKEKRLFQANVLMYDASLDIAVLELDSSLDGLEGLELDSSMIPHNDCWETYGFSSGKWNDGARLTGKVLRSHFNSEANVWDLDLVPDQNLESFEGLSGSPIIIDRVVKGVMLAELDGSLGAISINKVKVFLQEAGIEHDSNNKDKLVESLPSTPVIMDLEQGILNNPQGFLILKGNPGSGKTTLTNSYTPTTEKIKILGKYIIRDKLDKVPVSSRASEVAFAEWLEVNVFRELFNSLPAKKDRLLHEWVSHINDLLLKISELYEKEGRIGVIMVDGIEELYHLNKISSFFSLLSEKLPNNLVVVLSCQNVDILPLNIQAQITDRRVVKMIPLPIEQCRYFISDKMSDLELPLGVIDSIADKSEGHPLYLRYLIEYAKQLHNQEDIKNWIDQIPIFDGEIANYYELIWQGIKNNPHEIWILATIARVRQGIERPALEKIVPLKARYVFVSIFPKINHLLTDTETVSIYHTSFANFIIEKTTELERNIHSAIADFCIENEEHPYSISNVLFHLVNSEDVKRNQSVNYCNQNWADRCTTMHIDPDLLLQDLDQVLYVALNIGDLPEVIRLLLLSQRIKFRYNNIFAEYAAELASTLISIEKPQEAMRYIMRESVIIVPDNDALYFLYYFYDVQAYEEADELYQAIRTCFVNEMDRGSLSFATIELYFNSLSIKTGLATSNSSLEFAKQLQFLQRLLHADNQNKSETAKVLIENIVAFNKAFLLWKKDTYVPIQEMEKNGLHLNEDFATILCRLLINLEQFELWDDSLYTNRTIGQLLDDIKYVIEQYGCKEEDKPLILVALTDWKFSSLDIVKGLIKDVQTNTPPAFSLRMPNGVDLDYKSFYQYLDFWRYKGFIDDNEDYPLILDASEEVSDWESYFASITAFTGYILGKAWRANMTDKESTLIEIASMVEKLLLTRLTVPFKERISWNRSYFLPESFYPSIYKEILSFYKVYAQNQLPIFYEFIENHSSDQLGLYTEGYRDAMFKIISEGIKVRKNVKSIFSLLKRLEEHITFGVQNRWERSRDLIVITGLYAMIGSDRLRHSFQEMLDTSMGPSWYKEDQLTLIETCMMHLNHSGALPLYLKEIAGHLEFASGEMTFQRYIRQEREAFIGNLCATGLVSQAIKYYKQATLPRPDEVLNRVESAQIDYPDRGKGYIFGAGSLDEQSCILQIIENTSNVNGLLKWAYCELFIIGDDRYLGRFTKIMAELLNEREKSGSSELQFLFSRLLKIMISDMTETIRIDFMSHLSKWLSKSNNIHLINLIEKANLQIQIDSDEWDNTKYMQKEHVSSNNQDNNELFLPGTFGKRTNLHEQEIHFEQAMDHLEIENFDLAKQELLAGLRVAQEGAWNIWRGNVSDKIGHAFVSLTKITDVSELIKLMQDLILDEVYANDWLIANKLISLTGEKLKVEESSKVFQIVLDHIHFMLRTPTDIVEKYNWLEQEHKNSSTNIELTELFIWLLNHPSNSIKYRCSEILKGITRVEPNYFIPILGNYSLRTEKDLAAEVCAGILHSLCIEDPSLISTYLINEDFLNRVLEQEHFMVKQSYLEIVSVVSADNKNLSDFHHTLTNSFSLLAPDSLLKDEVDIPEWLHPFQHTFDNLVQEGVWDSKYYQELINSIVEKYKPLNPEELVRVDRYIAKSFRKVQSTGIMKTIVFNEINRILSNRVSSNKITEIANILRTYNPFFPSERLRLFHKQSVHSFIDDILLGTNDVEKLTHDDDFDYLHYFELVYSPKDGRYKNIEIIGFLARGDALQERLFKSSEIYETFRPNQIPVIEQVNSSSKQMYRPTIYKIEPEANIIGGFNTPAFIHPKFEQLLGEFDPKDIIRESWIEGREWDINKLGLPLREGSRLLISKQKVKKLNLTLWRLLWLVNYENTWFIIDRDNREVYEI